MKAISLWQPWASLIACGAKRFETRSWAPPRDLIGQPIAIHAAKKIDREAVLFAQDLCYGQHPTGGFELGDALEESWGGCPDELMGIFGNATMPIGCVVAIARLDAAFQVGEAAEGTALPAARVVRRLTSRQMPECFTVRYDDFGDYAAGRWAWLLRDVQAIKPPVAMKGAQGFFELPQGWLTADAA
jgi:hypothetical protein